jgi:hypothetical protein
MRLPTLSERAVKFAAYGLGAVLALAILVLTLLPGGERGYAKGPPNTGHAALACADCHTPAAGTVRQQLQAKAQYWLGMRTTDAAFGHEPVGNAQCATCHARDQDAHPVHRFLEPRFAQARAALGPQSCISCHREHQGVRATVAPTSCATCHQDLVLKSDPLDVPHKDLVARGDWSTCLGCHDYHGNHRRVTQTRLEDAYQRTAIIEYLAGGSSPYGRDLKYPTRTGAK